jgi:hypothetical protein
MTVPADTVTRLYYTGSGSTGPFTTPYFLANADLRVVKTLIADGTETILVLTTDYTLTGAGDEDGGALTLVSSLSSSYRLTIINDAVDSQETDYPRTDPFPAASHELALDRRTMVSLRLRDLIDRSLRQPDGDSAAIAELPPKVTRASKYLTFDSNGDPTVTTGSDAASQALGSGDALSVYVATTAQLYAIKKGTSASPDTSLGALLKVERTVNIAKSAIAGDGGESLAAFMAICSGTADNEAQPVGIYGAAKSAYSGAGIGSAKGDACGVYGVGRFTGSGSGIGMGAYFVGRRDTSTGYAHGIQIQTANYSGSAGAYNSSGTPNTAGIFMAPQGDADSGVAFCVGNPLGFQYKVGIGFNGEVNGGKTGGIADSSIRDDGNATTSIQINGTHSGGAINIAAGSGSINIGATATAGNLVRIAGALSGATACIGVFHAGTIAASVTSGYDAFKTTVGTAASAFTLSNFRHYYASQGTIGAGSAITDQAGFIVDSSMTGATNNYGFYGAIAAGSQRWNLYMVGTAQNYLAGVTGVGIAASASAALALAAGTTDVASLRIPHGAAPTSPVNGDVWTTTAGMFVRINGATVGPLS